MLKRVVDVVEIAALVAVAVFVVMLFANEPDEPGEPAATAGGGAEAAAILDGAALYADNCSSCHGDDGTGGFAPELGGGAVVEAFPDEAEQAEVVASGRGGMPAFGDRLTADEIAAVVEFTRTGL